MHHYQHYHYHHYHHHHYHHHHYHYYQRHYTVSIYPSSIPARKVSNDQWMSSPTLLKIVRESQHVIEDREKAAEEEASRNGG
ncbi:hypothetical protein HD806DRAFT_480492 [Xylariaceae sp. AK1471]|nr:hypothetical protein HD806DRAFT_480492 [Xylariaceae sp. AK1471]